MCKATSASCSELGTDPALWSKESPLPPPGWFGEQLPIFALAVKTMAAGETGAAMSTLSLIRSGEMRDWAIGHGMASGAHRKRAIGLSVSSLPREMRHAQRSPARYEKAVFERDAYHCRYCGLALVDKNVLSAFERCVASKDFLATLRSGEVRDPDLHGVVHAFKIVADHVEPHRTGGLTSLENLVSACPTCNYGKSWYTLDELGISDPRLRPPVNDRWDGLVSYLPQLTILGKKNAAL